MSSQTFTQEVSQRHFLVAATAQLGWYKSIKLTRSKVFQGLRRDEGTKINPPYQAHHAYIRTSGEVASSGLFRPLLTRGHTAVMWTSAVFKSNLKNDFWREMIYCVYRTMIRVVWLCWLHIAHINAGGSTS